jgi:lysophospholipase L1-like esterase/pimeloyl-ACP methyl ester carboxylesterase
MNNLIKLNPAHKIIVVSLLIIISFAASVKAQQKIKIACVGNSITYGYGIVNREKNNYPQQLQNMLGNDYEVMNFGVSATTLLKHGNNPYWKTKAYSDALAANPNMVFIKLGTNDSKAMNRPYYNEFESDYKELIQSFSQLPAHPRIVLLLPVPSFLEDSNSIYDPIIQKEIIPRIQNVAYQTGCEVINLYNFFIDKADLLPDKIHPTSRGANIIACRLYEVVRLNEKKGFDIFLKIKVEKKFSSFYGFESADFIFNNRNCKIVKPKKSEKGLPWIWRARFWGHEPQTDIALLERGFHLVYCDAVELFGNKEAIDCWNKFYDYMYHSGLSKKVVLEGMSRGGVYAYNWAFANPGKVACIYADAPVLDLKSWPGGKGKEPGSKEDWEIFKKDYNLSEEQANHFSNSPLDHAAKIATLGFPMLHVVGDADDVVPVEENTAPFEKIIKEEGGNITVICKPGVNHHPHSLKNPTPIVDFILRASGYKTNFAAIAAPGYEYRSAAGWKEDADWWKQNSDIDSLLSAEKKLDIVFIGNSITQGTVGHRPNVTAMPGKVAFDSVFKNYQWECAGISGDRTQNVLWRLQNGSYKTAQPKLVVLTIGVNNFSDDTAEEIAEGIHSIVQWMKINLHATKIILIGPLPAGIKKDDDKRMKYEKVQAIISKYKQRNMMYLPLSKIFIKNDGELDSNAYGGDGIHLLPEGYKIWAATLQPVIERLIK